MGQKTGMLKMEKKVSMKAITTARVPEYLKNISQSSQHSVLDWDIGEQDWKWALPLGQSVLCQK